ncbi:hypothetical protein NitYY0826_P24 (plasmid) [Nitratiruptor sp. YY08-26]|uniref:hypothetical protein n=1 Tax=unclassified Nitratiruptor TaxID=2624044 RepID=UPI0018ECE324|nr:MULTISPECIES: hypothetical protein [unclassified Nitratiruptor]BCD63183.1 hypothetical protein NitYY0813_P24 [Nitratiruptor sp. YY08-13]BCD67119.1 hypothetical protein NitYY0826_P24 [Nitratiruptor sp. YY08-26]
MNVIVFIVLLLTSFSLHASTAYKSLYQNPDMYNDKVGFHNKLLASGNKLVVSYTELNYKGEQIKCQEANNSVCIYEPDPHKFKWCSDKWYRYRVYIPKGTNLTMKIGSTRNTTYGMLYYFVPDGSTVKDVDLNAFKTEKEFSTKEKAKKYLLDGYNVLYQPINIVKWFYFKNVPKSGWLYINLNQASSIERSYQGYVRIAKPYLLAIHDGFPTSATGKNALINSLHFDSHGDPVENFAILHEKQKSCSGQNVLDIVGTGNSSAVDMRVDTTQNGDILHYALQFFSGKHIIEGISKKGIDGKINHNITISAHIDSCLQFVNVHSSIEGDAFYSADGKNWGNKSDASRYVKFEYQSPDSSGVVLDEEQYIKIGMEVKKVGNCQKTITNFGARYKVEEEIKEINISKTSYFSSWTSSSGDSNDNQSEREKALSCTYNGGKPIVVNGKYQGCEYERGSSLSSSSEASSSSKASSSSWTSSSGDSNDNQSEREKALSCTYNGGKPIVVNGKYQGCEYERGSSLSSSSEASSSSKASSSSWISSSGDSNDNQSEREKALSCTYNGGKPIVVNGKYQGCEYERGLSLSSSSEASSSSKASSSSWTSSVSNNSLLDKEKIAQIVANRSFPIKGYYIHYDESDPFGWLYISKTKSVVAKIEKPTDEKYNWNYIHSAYRHQYAFDNITINENSVSFGKNLLTEIMGDNSLLDKEKIAQIVANRSFPIKGYYIHYDESDPFGWLYISKTKSVVAKIEKPTDEKYNWNYIHSAYRHQYAFDNITINENSVSFGKNMLIPLSSQEESSSSASSVSSQEESSSSASSVSSQEESSSSASSVSSQEESSSSASSVSSQEESSSSVGAFGGIA